MKCYKFTARKSWSSHLSLSLETIAAMNNSDYTRIPKCAYLPDGTDILLDFQSLTEDAIRFTRAGYGILPSGVRFKIETHPHPDYFKNDGCGDCTFTLKIRSPFELTFEQ